MKPLTQPLRDEHQELLPHIGRIRQVAEEIGIAPIEEVRQSVEEVYRFLAFHLTPHAKAEEAALYPAVQKALGSPEATRTMSRDHEEIGMYIEELASLRDSLTGKELTITQITPLQRVLYGLYAVIKLHFAKEEEVYLPILDRHLTPESARQLFEDLEAAAHRAKHALRT